MCIRDSLTIAGTGPCLARFLLKRQGRCRKKRGLYSQLIPKPRTTPRGSRRQSPLPFLFRPCPGSGRAMTTAADPSRTGPLQAERTEQNPRLEAGCGVKRESAHGFHIGHDLGECAPKTRKRVLPPRASRIPPVQHPSRKPAQLSPSYPQYSVDEPTKHRRSIISPVALQEIFCFCPKSLHRPETPLGNISPRSL